MPIAVTSKFGLNSLYSTNKHWAVRKREAEVVHEAVKLALASKKIARQLIKTPVEIEIFFNSRLDIDNHGYLSKLIIDGLKGYLLEDDSPKFVKKLTQSYWNGKGILVKIREFNNLVIIHKNCKNCEVSSEK